MNITNTTYKKLHINQIYQAWPLVLAHTDQWTEQAQSFIRMKEKRRNRCFMAIEFELAGNCRLFLSNVHKFVPPQRMRNMQKDINGA